MEVVKSKNYHQLAYKVMPGGVNSPVRAMKNVGLDPIYIEKASGSKITDVDGNCFIDYVNSWGALILGHCDKDVITAIQKALSAGTSFGAPNQREIRLANLVLDFFPFAQMVRMTNSGTEAVMGAIRLARGYTKKNKIIKFNGCYHGHADYLLIKAGSGATTLGQADSDGVPNNYLQDTICLEFNDLDQVQKAINTHKNEIAAIIVEPVVGNMNLVLPKPNFLHGLRSICDNEGILLIFDEVMSGFRVAAGGCVELFKVEPDILVLGKIIGGGLPVGCFAARSEIMQCIAPLGKVYQAGTLSGNPLAMAAGIATLEKLKDPQIYRQLNMAAATLVEGMCKIAKQQDVPFYAISCGAMIGFGFRQKPISKYQDALKFDLKYFSLFFKEMLTKGIYLPPSSFEALFISTAHSAEDIDKTLQAFDISLTNLSKKGIYPQQ